MTRILPAYGQVNLGLSHEFKGRGWDAKPLTVRFDVVNLLDTICEIRDGSGIGVFAPQLGPAAVLLRNRRKFEHAKSRLPRAGGLEGGRGDMTDAVPMVCRYPADNVRAIMAGRSDPGRHCASGLGDRFA